MKRKYQITMFGIVIAFFAFFGGTCDRTILRGQIVPEKASINPGETVRLDLKIPTDLDGIHRIRWEVDPEDIGKIEYKEYPVRWDGKAYGKEDRIAYFTAERSGTCEIVALGFYKQTNPQLIDKLSLEIGMQEETVSYGFDQCRNLLNGAISPFKDYKVFEDTNYTEVTITSREYWDQKRLPRRVIELQEKGYRCSAHPAEFDYPQQEGDMLVQPAVTKVQWECVIPYQDYQYVSFKEADTKASLEAKGYVCKKTGCRDHDKDTFVWLCTQ